jgi:hypothetical protein
MPNVLPSHACPSRPYSRGRVILLGASGWSPSAELALTNLLSTSFPKIYGANWMLQLKPLTYQQIRKIVKGAMYYYGLGYSTKEPQKFFRNLQAGFAKSDPSIQKEAITKVLFFISGIDPSKYPGDIALLKTGKYDSQAQSTQNEIASTQAKEDLAYEIQDKIDRGVKAIADKAIDAGSFVQSALPWYLRPTTLLPVALLGAVAYFYIQKKGLSTIARTIYKSNPISPREVLRQKANESYKVFHDRKPKKTISIPHIETSELVELGKGLELGYKSKKWTGKSANYLHKFGPGVRLMMTPDRKTLILQGGQMRVEDVGIIN